MDRKCENTHTPGATYVAEGRPLIWGGGGGERPCFLHAGVVFVRVYIYKPLFIPLPPCSAVIDIDEREKASTTEFFRVPSSALATSDLALAPFHGVWR